MTQERALTWSRKWHIVDQKRTHERDGHGKRYGVSICGSYVYLDDDPHYPSQLKAIRDEGAKDAGVCKRCLKLTKVTTVTVELPERVEDPFHDALWHVPLTNPYNGVVGEPFNMFTGEIWIGSAGSKMGKIVVTSVPSILDTADDARRFAAALLAAAEWKDAHSATE